VLVARAEVEATAPAVARGDWVMLADRVGIGAAVAARLGAQGGQVTLVEAAAQATASATRALAVVRRLAGFEGAPRLWLVTRGAQPVVERVATVPAQAPVWGLGRVVALEHPER